MKRRSAVWFGVWLWLLGAACGEPEPAPTPWHPDFQGTVVQADGWGPGGLTHPADEVGHVPAIPAGMAAEGDGLPAEVFPLPLNHPLAQITLGVQSLGFASSSSDEGSAAALPKGVHGETDSRKRLVDTTVFPRSTVVRLTLQWRLAAGEYETSTCSGTLVSRDAAVTAAHCLFDNERGGWVHSVKVIPALSGNYKPFGETYATRVFTAEAFRRGPTALERGPFDWGIVRLHAPMGERAGVRLLSEAPLQQESPLEMFAYHEDSGRSMQHCEDAVRSLHEDGTFVHLADTRRGASGGGMGAPHSPDFIAGLHIHGYAGHNVGVMLSPPVVRVLSAWLRR